jgi:REP element-mobilizing transposase RayT
MARKPREHEPGSYVHAIALGNNHGAIYLRDADRLMFLRMLRRQAHRSDWLLLSYCLMTTHAHFVFQVGDQPVSPALQVLLGGYARTFNLTYGRKGHLFQNRYFSLIAKTERHGLELCRYVALNPVRAGVCQRPEQWPWSSYASTIGLARESDFVAASHLLALFDATASRARAAFRAFVERP